MSTLAVIHADALRYVLPHVSKEESRPILNGMYCEPSGVIVATGGHTLCMHANAVEGLPRPIILRFEKVASVTAKKVDHITFDVTDTPDYSTPVMVTLRTSYGAPMGATLAYEVEGPYPHYRNVLPREESAAPLGQVAIDPAKLDRFSVNGHAVTLDFHGATSAIGVRYAQNPNAYGLIMPMVNAHLATNTPEWVRGSATDAPLPLSADHADRYAVAVPA